jgi:hypothetical protein
MTVQLANRKGAETTAPDGTPLSFAADQPVEVDNDFAHELLGVKDAGYYIPGDDQPEFTPYVSVNESERRGHTRPSPFPLPPEAEDEQAILDAAEAELAKKIMGVDIPPQYGRGSSAAAWLDYAQALGHEPPQGASRDEIIQFLDARGVPTEEQGETATIGGNPDEAAAPDEDEEPKQEEPPPIQVEVDPAPVVSEVNPESAE